MSRPTAAQQPKTAATPAPAPAFSPAPSALIQRQCACGGSAGLSGQCTECAVRRFSAGATALAHGGLSTNPEERETGLAPGLGLDFGKIQVGGNPEERIQPKLRVSQPGDASEREADRVADAVTRMPDPNPVHRQGPTANGQAALAPKLLQRQPEEDEDLVQPKLLQRQPDDDEEIEAKLLSRMPEDDLLEDPVEDDLDGDTIGFRKLNRMPADLKDDDELDTDRKIAAKESPGQTPAAGPGVQSQIGALRGSGGRPLPESSRAFFEPRFGLDLSNVRIHTDARAAETAATVNARAFTLGRDIVFGQGQYHPGSTEGKRLMAHELAHVGQQLGGLQDRRALGQMVRAVALRERKPREALQRLLSRQPPEKEETIQAKSDDRLVRRRMEEEKSVHTKKETDRLQLTPTKNGALVSRQATPLNKIWAQKALLAWHERSLAQIDGMRAWTAANLTTYLGFTSSNPRMSWQESFTYSVLSNAFGNALSGGLNRRYGEAARMAARKLSVRALGTALGTAVAPGVGTVIGFIIGAFLETAASIFFDWFSGKKSVGEAAAEASETTALLIEAETTGFEKEHRTAKDKAMRVNSYQEIALTKARNQSQVNKIGNWARNEADIIEKPKDINDRSLYKKMIYDWILENAADEQNANWATDQDQWKRALDVAKDPKIIEEKRKKLGLPPLPQVLKKGPDLDNHPELFIYQIRSHWANIGVEPKARSLRFKGDKSDESKRDFLFKHFKAMTNTSPLNLRADPYRFLQALPNMTLQDKRALLDLISDRYRLLATVYLGEDDGTTYLEKIIYEFRPFYLRETMPNKPWDSSLYNIPYTYTPEEGLKSPYS